MKNMFNILLMSFLMTMISLTTAQAQAQELYLIFETSSPTRLSLAKKIKKHWLNCLKSIKK